MVYVGTSGWAYSSWKPKFYPAELPETKFLSFYSRHLNAVEVNYTFCGRHVLRPRTAARWLAETADDFVFAFRAPKPITHFHRHRLRNAENNTRRFEAELRPFLEVARLGPVLFQLPRTFNVDVRVLDQFLSHWPRDLRVSFEFRHPSWFRTEVYEVLRRHNAALCFAERDELVTPEVITASFVYMRLRKPRYGTTAIRHLGERIADYARRGDLFAFFRQDDVRAPFYAQELQRRVGLEKVA